MVHALPAGTPSVPRSSWQQTTTRYQQPDLRHSLGQVADSVLPYLALWYLMYRSLNVSYWLTLALAVPTAAFLIRSFIIFHDCGHGAFFRSPRANAILGIITGLFVFTPYEAWRHAHAIHHATAGDLDRRGVGDVWTLTVQEYRALPPFSRFAYRMFRNPFIMLGIGPIAVFVFAQRLPIGEMGKRRPASILWTDVAVLVIFGLAALTIGLPAFLLVQTPVLMLAGAAGVWLFYVQHQFEGVRWERHAAWDYYTAAMEGASYYQLPRLLQWVSGNIGFHHIHHLNSRIPNYNLAACYRANLIFQQVKPLTLRSALPSLRLRLWDEERRQMVGYEDVR
jgi:acyl-lipid omega-6 desaturase (Delta-12 desaturase)